MTFQYPEDRDFFVSFLVDGDEGKFESEYKDYFDFRDPKIKRADFDKLRPELFRELVGRNGLKCQLKIHSDCSKIARFEVEHVIPLSTNELNKKLRHIKRTSWQKVESQSFGSNNIKNLVIACSRCNAYKKHRFIKPAQWNKESSSGFLDAYPSGIETIKLSIDRIVYINKYFLTFKKWNGKPIASTYGRKAVIDFNGEPVFAELAALRLAQSHGWQGAWVDKTKYRIGLLDVAPINIPEDKQKIIDKIRSKISGSGGCWDLFLWKENQILFIELKSKIDHVQDSQIKWLEVSLDLGYPVSNFIFIEWESIK